ncbi:hypothetical protein BDV93DRAFT_332876 [Ceratobasidium sp. AG-I]|nr:hypothetical protein BDV93DRAFT_332876 [Ceratobasidium sp. AG-I]
MDISLGVGPILLGGMINTFLCGALVMQCNFYFSNFSQDRLWLRALVLYMLVMNLANTGFDMALVWYYTITLFGNYEMVKRSMWLYTIEPVMTVMISTVTQIFYAWRIARLTGRLWVGGIIVASALAQFGAGVGGSIGFTIVTDFNLFPKFKTTVIVWLGLSAATDMTITFLLVWYLHTHRTGFPTTDSAIRRLVRLTIQSGLITTICAVADLVTFLCLEDNLHIFFQLLLCKMYSTTLMATLNARTDPKTRPQTAEVQENSGVRPEMGQRCKSAALPSHHTPVIERHNQLGHNVPSTSRPTSSSMGV